MKPSPTPTCLLNCRRQLPCRPGRPHGPVRPAGGFTLIELMIAVAVVAALAATALTATKSYRIASNRSAAKAVLMDIATRQEQYVIQNRAYAGTPADLGMSVPDDVQRAYRFDIALGTLDAAKCTTSTVTVTTASGPVDYDTYASSDPASPLACLPTMLATATPVVGTIQEGDLVFTINQFGLRMQKRLIDIGWKTW